MRRLARLEGWQRHALALGCSAVAVAAVTVVIELLKPHAPVISLGVLYVFAVLAVAGVFGLGYSVLVSVASMLAFNWFFLPPVDSFTLSDRRNWVVLTVLPGSGRRRQHPGDAVPFPGGRRRAAGARDGSVG